MRKVLASLLVFTMLICSTITASAKEITVEDKIAYLISQGFPEDFFEFRSGAEISEIYDMLYGEDIEFLGTETVGMTETVNPSDASTYGIISESDMLLTINGTYSLERDSTTGRNKIKKMFVFVSHEWFSPKPSVTHKDGITVNWDSSLFTLEEDMFTAREYVKYASHGDNWYETAMYTNPSDINQGGLGYVADLGAFSDYLANGVRGSAIFSLLPRKTIYSGSSQTASINVRYVHDKNPFWGTVNFSHSGFGVTVNLSGLQDSVAKPFNYSYST